MLRGRRCGRPHRECLRIPSGHHRFGHHRFGHHRGSPNRIGCPGPGAGHRRGPSANLAGRPTLNGPKHQSDAGHRSERWKRRRTGTHRDGQPWVDRPRASDPYVRCRSTGADPTTRHSSSDHPRWSHPGSTGPDPMILDPPNRRGPVRPGSTSCEWKSSGRPASHPVRGRRPRIHAARHWRPTAFAACRPLCRPKSVASRWLTPGSVAPSGPQACRPSRRRRRGRAWGEPAGLVPSSGCRPGGVVRST